MSGPLPLYIVGTLIELSTTFVDDAGAPIDPTTVTCKILLPDESEQSPAVTRRDVGDYFVGFTPTLNGIHQYRFAGVGAAVAADESYFMAQTVFPG